MSVAVHYNSSADGAKETVAEIEAAGGKAEIFQADLASARAPAELVEAVAARLGGLAVVVNSAAVMEKTPIGAVTPEAWDAMFALNLRAPFMISQAAGPLMKSDGGAIVNIADLAAFESWPAYIPHSITKAAIVKMTSSLARVLAPEIRVNAIAPGFYLTEQNRFLLTDEKTGKLTPRGETILAHTPMGRFGQATELLGTTIWLCSDASKFVTGIVVPVD